MPAANIIRPISNINDCTTEELKQILQEALNLINNYLNLGAEYEKLPLLQEFSAARAEQLETSFIKSLFKDILQIFLIGKLLFKDEAQKRLQAVKRDLMILGLDVFAVERENDKRLGVASMKRLLIGTNQKAEAELAIIYQEEIEEFQPRLAKATEDLANSAVVKYIPEDYRYPFALDTMLKYLRNGNAQNWQECVNRFDDQQERQEMQREQLIILNQIKRSATAAAIFSGITAWNTL
jgi:hypothetical protein